MPNPRKLEPPSNQEPIYAVIDKTKKKKKPMENEEQDMENNTRESSDEDQPDLKPMSKPKIKVQDENNEDGDDVKMTKIQIESNVDDVNDANLEIEGNIEEDETIKQQ